MPRPDQLLSASYYQQASFSSGHVTHYLERQSSRSTTSRHSQLADIPGYGRRLRPSIQQGRRIEPTSYERISHLEGRPTFPRDGRFDGRFRLGDMDLPELVTPDHYCERPGFLDERGCLNHSLDYSLFPDKHDQDLLQGPLSLTSGSLAHVNAYTAPRHDGVGENQLPALFSPPDAPNSDGNVSRLYPRTSSIASGSTNVSPGKRRFAQHLPRSTVYGPDAFVSPMSAFGSSNDVSCHDSHSGSTASGFTSVSPGDSSSEHQQFPAFEAHATDIYAHSMPSTSAHDERLAIFGAPFAGPAIVSRRTSAPMASSSIPDHGAAWHTSLSYLSPAPQGYSAGGGNNLGLAFHDTNLAIENSHAPTEISSAPLYGEVRPTPALSLQPAVQGYFAERDNNVGIVFGENGHKSSEGFYGTQYFR